MRVNSSFAKTLMLAVALVLMSSTLEHSQDPRIQILASTTTPKSAIKKPRCLKTARSVGFFDIGAGIGAGQTVELVWDKATDNDACEQYFKVQFADGEWSDAVKFNFCEKDLILEVQLSQKQFSNKVKPLRNPQEAFLFSSESRLR